MTAWIMFPLQYFSSSYNLFVHQKNVCVWLGLCIESILAEVEKTLWFRLDANTCKHTVLPQLCQHVTSAAVFS